MNLENLLAKSMVVVLWVALIVQTVFMVSDPRFLHNNDYDIGFALWTGLSLGVVLIVTVVFTTKNIQTNIQKA